MRLFDDGHLEAELGGANRRYIAARPGADHDNVVAIRHALRFLRLNSPYLAKLPPACHPSMEAMKSAGHSPPSGGKTERGKRSALHSLPLPCPSPAKSAPRRRFLDRGPG